MKWLSKIRYKSSVNNALCATVSKIMIVCTTALTLCGQLCFFLSNLPVVICEMVEFHLGGNLFLIQNLYSIRISTQMIMLFNVSLRYIKWYTRDTACIKHYICRGIINSPSATSGLRNFYTQILSSILSPSGYQNLQF